MNRTFKKLVVTGLALTLAVTTLAGCGAKKKDTAADLSNIETMTENTLPISKEEITLDVWCENGAKDFVKSYNDMSAVDEIAKRTGVRLNFVHPTGATQEQLNIILASNDYPDIIFSNWDSKAAKVLDDNIAIRLNDYIDKLAPNFKKILEQEKGIKEQITLPTGDIVSFPQLALDDKFLCYDGYFIRQDWLDKVGKKVPTTIDEWHDVLVAFKTQDPNGNGKADEIAFGGLPYMFKDAFISSFGVTTYYSLDPKTQKMTHASLQPGYKEYIATMAQWFKEGLIDPNYLNAGKKEVDALMLNDTLGAYYGDNNNSMPKYMQMKPELKLTAVPYPIGPAGKAYYPTPAVIRTARSQGGIITSSCKNVKEAVRICDYLYSEEGQTLLNWGIEGESFTKDANGKKQFTDKILKNPEGKVPYEAICQYFTNRGIMGVVQYEAASGLESNLDPKIKAVKADSVKYAQEADKSLLTYNLKLTVEESREFDLIESEVKTYRDEMVSKFILGIEPIENYDKFVNDMKSLKIERAIEIQQAAYDRQMK
ncbi:MAG: extracellular solute-binding protein [Oscillospiraceae bacterium]